MESWWVRNRNAVTGEAEALWFGASNKQKTIVVVLMGLCVLLGRVSARLF